MPTINTRITASNETKETFELIQKTTEKFFEGAREGWKKQIERTKEQKETTHIFSKAVSGDRPDNIVGAFTLASAASSAFGAGMLNVFGGAAAGAAAFATKAIQEFASVEDGINRLLATGKVTHEEIEHLKKDWEGLGPVVDKNIKQLMADYNALLLTNDKLAGNFAQMEQFQKVTGASFSSILTMANTAAIGGVKPSEMPAYLDKAATAFAKLGENGVRESARVSTAYRELGITGSAVQNQINIDIAALAKFMGGAEQAGNALIKVIEQAAGGKGDSKMQGMIKNLRDGTMSLNEFFDMMLKRNDPSNKWFQDILMNDPATRKLVLAWKDAHPDVERITASTSKIADSPILKESTTTSINRLSGALERFSEVSGSLMKAAKLFNYLADSINRMSEAMERFGKTGNPRDALDATGGLYHALPGGAFIDMLIAPSESANKGVVPGGPGARSNKKPTPSWFQGGKPEGGVGKPVFFSGSGGAEDAQGMNESDIHEMIMEEERSAAFTPGAGEWPWSQYAMVPPSMGGAGGGGSGGGGGGSGGSDTSGGGSDSSAPAASSSAPAASSSAPSSSATPSSATSSTTPAAASDASAPSNVSATANSDSSGASYEDNMQWLRDRGGHDARDSNEPGGLNPEMAARLRASGEAYEKQTGKKANYGEMFRDRARQAVYYDRYKRGTGGLAAPPGRSRHEQGKATDVPRGGYRDWLAEGGHAGEHGLEFLPGKAYAADPVHVQMSDRKPIQAKIEVVPPERHEIEKAARHQYRATGGVARRHRQSSMAGNLGYA